MQRGLWVVVVVMDMIIPEIYLYENWSSSWVRIHSEKKEILALALQESSSCQWLQFDYSLSIISNHLVVIWELQGSLEQWCLAEIVSTGEPPFGNSSDNEGALYSWQRSCLSRWGNQRNLRHYSLHDLYMTYRGWKPEKLRLCFLLCFVFQLTW